MIWHLVGHWLSFLIPAFYKRIEIHGLEHLRTSDPVIIAMNHPNAFTDPIAISSVTYPIRLHYMARGDAFKPGPAAWILRQIGIIPIFRMQDGGKEGLKKNDAAYEEVNRLLANNAKVIVFAEGLCVQERRLRPLKKGVARMVFGAYTAIGNDRLKVIPIGVNYSRPNKFRSKILYNVGEAFAVKDYMQLYDENPARAYNVFLQNLEKKMLDLVTHIPRPELDQTVHHLEKLAKPLLLHKSGNSAPSLRSEFELSRQLISRLESAQMSQPQLVTEFRDEAKEYFSALKETRLKDWLFRPEQQRRNNFGSLVFRVLILAMVFPFYIVGMAANFPPLFLTYILTGRLVKLVEFYSSFAIGIAAFVFPVFYLLWFFVFLILTGNPFWAMAGCVAISLCGWACLHIHPLILRTIGLARFLKLKDRRQIILARRRRVVELINKF